MTPIYIYIYIYIYMKNPANKTFFIKKIPDKQIELKDYQKNSEQN